MQNTEISSHYHKTRTYQSHQLSSQQSTKNSFISPQQMMQGLLSQGARICNCGKSPFNNQSEGEGTALEEYDRSEIVIEIEKMEEQLHNMDNQVVEVENMLSVRDNLYEQLDQLRIEREQIQQSLEIEGQHGEFSQPRNRGLQGEQLVIKQVRTNTGVKEMSQRLKRRIIEVKQYIQKMDIENQRIEQTIINGATHKSSYEVEQRGYGKSRQYRTNHNYSEPAIGETYNRDYSFARTNEYFDDLRKRLETKQEEAWMRMRSQEEDIAGRNRATFNKLTDMYGNNHSPRFHTSYGEI